MSWNLFGRKTDDEPKTPEEPKIGDFLFATEINSLNVYAIARKGECTQLTYWKENGIPENGQYLKWDLTDEQHRELIKKLSDEIPSIVVKGDQ